MINCPECKESLMSFDKFDILFCPFCGFPLSSEKIKEWETPQIFEKKTFELSKDVRALIHDLEGNIVGWVSSNNKCAEINILGYLCVRINLKLLHPEILIDKNGNTKLEIVKLLA
ncbi:MAG: hypothetical protein ACTSQ8_19200 [Candidatus Helarchaeota archaeon]